MGKTFREAFDLQQSTQRNYYLTKVKVESVFRILLHSHFYHLLYCSTILSLLDSHSGASRWVRGLLSPELWGLQSSTKVENRWRLRGNPGPLWPGDQEFEPLFSSSEWGQEARLTSLWRTSFLLGGRSTTGRTKSHTISNNKIKLPCIRLDQAKRLIKAAKAGN